MLSLCYRETRLAGSHLEPGCKYPATKTGRMIAHCGEEVVCVPVQRFLLVSS